jgi:hypothetical protein
MRKIPLSYSLLYYLEELEHTEAALSADSDAAVLVKPFTNALAEWDDVFKNERAARRSVIRAEAVVAVRDGRLDDLTMRFAALVRALDPGLLDRLFTLAPGRFIRRGLRQQCEKTRDVIVVELDKLPAKNQLKPYGAMFKEGLEGALTALDERSKVKGSRQSTASDVDEWKEGINALRTTTYAELLKIATEKGLSKAWVEMFFRATSSPSPSEEAEPTEPAAPDADALGKTPA